MKYDFSKTITLSFDDAIHRVTEGLKKEGFGILTDIDEGQVEVAILRPGMRVF